MVTKAVITKKPKWLLVKFQLAAYYGDSLIKKKLTVALNKCLTDKFILKC